MRERRPRRLSVTHYGTLRARATNDFPKQTDRPIHNSDAFLSTNASARNGVVRALVLLPRGGPERSDAGKFAKLLLSISVSEPPRLRDGISAYYRRPSRLQLHYVLHAFAG